MRAHSFAADHARAVGLIGSPQSDRLFGQIVDKLAIGIVSGTYPAGKQLPNETELDGALNASRTAYREAIKYLTAKGLIEAKPRSGTRVRPRSDWNLLDPDILRWSLQGGATAEFARDIFELRRCIEPDAARLAAQRRTPQQLRAIQDALVGMETLPPLSAQSMAADMAFHERIFEASGNPVLACLKSVVSSSILWSLEVKRDFDNGAFVRSLREHRRVYEAIAAGDGELASATSTALIVLASNDTAQALDLKVPVVGGAKKSRAETALKKA